MIIGILSDPHGKRLRFRRALATLRACGAEAIFCCGDFERVELLDELVGLSAWFVFGNCDEPEGEFQRYALSIGLTPPTSSPVFVDLLDQRIAFGHGHERFFVQLDRDIRSDSLDLARSRLQCAQYLLHGHTHQAADSRILDTRVINPGALQRARVYTVATLNLKTDELKYWRIDDDRAPDADPEQIPLEDI
ncbi:MAG: metallophosphoesterase family protein [Phycisphaerae bacterium]